ncbi:MAG: 3-phosphoshikimate 1-carboxyvinyltransferase, partial [Phycisphaerales bacterium]
MVIRPPGSKSITNRALLLAGLCEGESVLRHALVEADDAQRMLAAIKVLGARVDDSQADESGILRVVGTGGRWKTSGDETVIDLHNAGTATRFLSASALLADSAITITGNERMQQRPIGELVELLETLGARVEYLGNEGYPPMRIGCSGKLKANQVVIGATQSSQFISALMLVGVFLDEGLILSMPEGTTSASYVRMTLELLEYLGATVQSAQDLSVVRMSKGLSAFDLEIEADASGATYWWAAGALLHQAMIRIDGVPTERSLQGDAKFGELLTRMGCVLVERDGTVACRGAAELKPIMCDMSDMPDAVMSLGAVACFASGTSVIKGVR